MKLKNKCQQESPKRTNQSFPDVIDTIKSTFTHKEIDTFIVMYKGFIQTEEYYPSQATISHLAKAGLTTVKKTINKLKSLKWLETDYYHRETCTYRFDDLFRQESMKQKMRQFITSFTAFAFCLLLPISSPANIKNVVIEEKNLSSEQRLAEECLPLIFNEFIFKPAPPYHGPPGAPDQPESARRWLENKRARAAELDFVAATVLTKFARDQIASEGLGSRNQGDGGGTTKKREIKHVKNTPNNFSQEQLAELQQFPQEIINYANKELTKHLLAGKPVTSQFGFFLAICARKANEKQTPKTGSYQATQQVASTTERLKQSQAKKAEQVIQTESDINRHKTKIYARAQAAGLDIERMTYGSIIRHLQGYPDVVVTKMPAKYIENQSRNDNKSITMIMSGVETKMQEKANLTQKQEPYIPKVDQQVYEYDLVDDFSDMTVADF